MQRLRSLISCIWRQARHFCPTATRLTENIFVTRVVQTQISLLFLQSRRFSSIHILLANRKFPTDKILAARQTF